MTFMWIVWTFMWTSDHNCMNLFWTLCTVIVIHAVVHIIHGLAVIINYPHCITLDIWPLGRICYLWVLVWSALTLLVLRQMGQKEREVLQKMAETTKEGFLLKQQLIQEAKKTQQEKQVKIKSLKALLLSVLCF